MAVIIMLVFSGTSKAQIMTPTVVNINGFTATMPDGYITISVGESAISTLNGLSGIITQGFLQPELEPPCSDFLLNYFPNPVADILTIRDTECGRIVNKIEVYDLLGNEVLQETLVNREADLSGLGVGIFIIKGYSVFGQLLGTFKIVKVTSP